MIKFNDNNIIVGYINQLLATYNLPTFKIYKDRIFKGVNYLYNGKIMRANKTKIKTETNNITESDFKFVCYYSEDFRKLVYYKDNNKLINYNLVDHLPIDNLTYNANTHAYLGNFLRFISDYEGINLLSLYNCFSNEMPKNLNIELSKTIFNSEDNNYKIYSIPVKFFKNYTIAIESDTPVEITCGFYNNNISYNVEKELNEITYQKFPNMRFNQPVLYSKINNIDVTEKHMLAEKDLKIFIKLSSSTNSSIVILEGDYRNKSNNVLLDPNTSTKGLISNIVKHNNSDTMNSKSQLLAINSGISYPFADRLIEYLVKNVVANNDDVADNIKRFQQYLFKYKNITIKNYGIWDNNYSKIIENIAIENNMNDYDLLFYVDKDIESKINLDIDIYGGNK